MHRVRAYTFHFCSFLSVAYTTLNKLFAVFFIYYLIITLQCFKLFDFTFMYRAFIYIFDLDSLLVSVFNAVTQHHCFLIIVLYFLSVALQTKITRS